MKNGEKEEYVELSVKPHKCIPIKFIPEDITVKIVNEPDFKLYEVDYGKSKIQRLTIFDSKDKKYGYIYSYKKSDKYYRCLKCKAKNKLVTAKVLQDENGQNYVELSKTDHVCEIQKL
uniref:Uncharacterized protein n=1 Tax=Panagrolaimus sp. ES5 TaxID=591445 RepID=A0AC34FW17_9BILA